MFSQFKKKVGLINAGAGISLGVLAMTKPELKPICLKAISFISLNQILTHIQQTTKWQSTVFTVKFLNEIFLAHSLSLIGPVNFPSSFFLSAINQGIKWRHFVAKVNISFSLIFWSAGLVTYMWADKIMNRMNNSPIVQTINNLLRNEQERNAFIQSVMNQLPADIINRVQTRRILTPEIINQRCQTRPATDDDLNINCSICLSHLDQEILELPCNHKFHKECIMNWFNNHNTCPNCRQPIN